MSFARSCSRGFRDFVFFVLYLRTHTLAPYNRGLSQPMHVTAIIAAGGRGQRFGGEQPKQLLQIGGRAILERSLAAFLTHPGVHEVIVALPQTLADDPPHYLRGTSKPIRIVAGGARRQD